MSKENEKPTTVTLGDLTDKNVKLLRVLNTTCLPVTYPDAFYKAVLLRPELTKFAYFGDVPVGAIACRLDETRTKLYIMTLVVLPPYQRRGIGQKLLQAALDLAQKEPSVQEIALDVQVNNAPALAFYAKNNFVTVREEKDYYKNVQPADAFHLARTVVHGGNQ